MNTIFDLRNAYFVKSRMRLFDARELHIEETKNTKPGMLTSRSNADFMKIKRDRELLPCRIS